MSFLLLAIAVLGVSASGPLMAAIAAPALAIAFWRNAIATVALTPFAAQRRGELLTVSRRGRVTTLVAAVALAAHFAFWAGSLKLTSVASATALVSMQVLFVVGIDVLRGRRESWKVVAGCALALVGVMVVSGIDLSVSTRAITGDAMAVAAGLFSALYTIAGAEVRRELSTAEYTFACYGVTASLLLAVLLATGTTFTGFSLRTWLLLGLLTVMAQLLGHSIINHVLGWLSPLVVSLALLLEVPGAAILAATFLGQSLPWGAYAGLTLIFTGLVIVTLTRSEVDKAEILGVD